MLSLNKQIFKVQDKWVIKSGTDLKELSFVKTTFDEKLFSVEKIEKYIIDSKIEENYKVKSLVDSYMGKI